MIEVSVIVPTHNEESNIDNCIKSLLNQTYPTDKYEVLFVDNGSNDSTKSIIQSYGLNPLIYTSKASSYAARNHGIAHAKGKIIAFTDGDCRVDKHWIQNSMEYFKEHNTDMIGGNIIFEFTDKPSNSELLDSVIHLQNEHNVKKRSCSVTANLFVNHDIFNHIGLFHEDSLSGADIEFSHRAIKSGYKLSYASDSIVFHYARNRIALFKKIKRTAIGKSKLNKSSNSIKPKFKISFPFRASINRLDQLNLPRYRALYMLVYLIYLKAVSLFYYMTKQRSHTL